MYAIVVVFIESSQSTGGWLVAIKFEVVLIAGRANSRPCYVCMCTVSCVVLQYCIVLYCRHKKGFEFKGFLEDETIVLNNEQASSGLAKTHTRMLDKEQQTKQQHTYICTYLFGNLEGVADDAGPEHVRHGAAQLVLVPHLSWHVMSCHVQNRSVRCSRRVQNNLREAGSKSS